MKYFALILLCFSIYTSAVAQDVYSSSGRPDHAKKQKKEEGFDPSKLILGGGIGLGFGNQYADIVIAPTVGYRFTNHFAAGIGLGYEYYKNQLTIIDPYYGTLTTYPEQANIITPNIWGRYFVWRNIFIDGTFEYDLIRYSQYTYTDNFGNIVTGKYNVNVPCLLGGLGVKQPLGGRAYAYFEILYDVLQNTNSPYYGTIVPRAGILVGL